MGNEEWRNGEWGMSFVLVSGHTNKSCRGLPVDADHACRAFFFPPLSSGMPNMASSDLVDIDSDSSDSVLPEVSWLTPCAEKDYKVKMEVIEIFSSPETTPIKNTPVITHQAPQGDIKPGNVLYREKPEFCLKLADFGLTKHLDAAFSVNQTSVFTTASTSLCGTRGWMAPELVKRTQNTHSKESDMYALGLLLHFLFSKGFHPFHSSTMKLLDSISTGSLKAYELETNISKGNGHIRKDLTPEQNHLVLCLLSEDPKKRPSSVDLKKHHCYFWTNMKKVNFMWRIGDQKEVAKPLSCPNSTLGKNLQSTKFGQAVMRDSWNVNISALFQEVASRGRGNIDTNSVLGLIRFFRNAYAHYEERSPDRKDELLNDHFFKTFPEFFVVVWTEVYNQGWMNSSGNKHMLRRIIQEID
ncbi:Serine/threonine-protein kinase/endoribonuclease IRE1b [Exaiptasia diaphana]|nr:Serine/threonine-protein kinase/endoribonuclease IRE1b [Exaiptasia diaphana]